MSMILSAIIEAKQAYIAETKPLFPLSKLTESAYWQLPRRSLKARLNDGKSTGVIAEFKRKSPSKGFFKSEDHPVKPVVNAYSTIGAAGISVLTDTPFFGGTLKDLQAARDIVSVPLLRKDFIIEEWQIAEAKANGADLILLIASCLSPAQVSELTDYAHEIGLEVLLEIHDESELNHIGTNADMVGVNNRNLKTFEVDIATSFRLIEAIRNKGKIAVAESGITDVQTIKQLKNVGYSGFLIGETFMKEPDTTNAFASFIQQLND